MGPSQVRREKRVRAGPRLQSPAAEATSSLLSCLRCVAGKEELIDRLQCRSPSALLRPRNRI
jgi:hypothetical protein